MPNVFAYSVRSLDNRGLDPARFKVVMAVHRVDGGLLTEEDLAEARAALAPIAAPQQRPAKSSADPLNPPADLGGKASSKGKSKAPSKPAAKGRKASKAPARKAARRPAGG